LLPSDGGGRYASAQHIESRRWQTLLRYLIIFCKIYSAAEGINTEFITRPRKQEHGEGTAGSPANGPPGRDALPHACGEAGEQSAGAATTRVTPRRPGWPPRVRIMESRNHEGSKRPPRSSSPTANPTPPCLLNHVPKGHIHTVFEPLQGWGLHHCPGQPGPRPDRSFRKDIFHNIQPEPPLTQLEAIASWPFLLWQEEMGMGGRGGDGRRRWGWQKEKVMAGRGGWQ